jgi:hypothetical protein
MSFVDRAKNILLQPAQEWEVIAKEPATVGSLFTGYAAILALLPAIASALFMGVLGIGLGGMGAGGAMMAGLGMSYWITTAVVGYFVGLGLLWLVSFIVKSVSPSFNGNSDMVQATKLMVYSATPTWVAGLIVPFLGARQGACCSRSPPSPMSVYLIYTGRSARSWIAPAGKSRRYHRGDRPDLPIVAVDGCSAHVDRNRMFISHVLWRRHDGGRRFGHVI